MEEGFELLLTLIIKDQEVDKKEGILVFVGRG